MPCVRGSTIPGPNVPPMIRSTAPLTRHISPTDNGRRFPPARDITVRLLAFAVLTITPAWLAGCGGPSEAKGPGGKKGDGPPPALVATSPVRMMKVPPHVTVVGTVVPMRTAVVASGANGIVNEYDVEEGQFVRTGDPLSILRMVTTNLEIEKEAAIADQRKHELDELVAGSRVEDIDEANANLKSAVAAFQFAQNRSERIERIFRQNAANQSDRDDAQEQLEAARQRLAAATAVRDRVVAGPRKEEILQARANWQSQAKHVAWLEAEKMKRTTRAPFDGYIVEEHTFVGQWLAKGDPVVTLAILDEVDVLVNVDQQSISRVKVGEQAQVRIPGAHNQKWTGTITQIVPRSDWKTGSRGFPVKVRMKNPLVEANGSRQPLLKEGMLAEVTFSGDPIDAIMIHKDSLVRTAQGTSIFVFVPEGEVTPGQRMPGSVFMVPIRTGLGMGEMIQCIPIPPPGQEALAEKIQDGTLLVTEGAERLRPVQSNVVSVPKPAADSGQGKPAGEGTRPKVPAGEKK